MFATIGYGAGTLVVVFQLQIDKFEARQPTIQQKEQDRMVAFGFAVSYQRVDVLPAE
ncbi:MAG: hypothetical protein R2867_19720 [Caldilineaceae bacterium]